jgi:hypothetical protein
MLPEQVCDSRDFGVVRGKNPDELGKEKQNQIVFPTGDVEAEATEPQVSADPKREQRKEIYQNA